MFSKQLSKVVRWEMSRRTTAIAGKFTSPSHLHSRNTPARNAAVEGLDCAHSHRCYGAHWARPAQRQSSHLAQRENPMMFRAQRRTRPAENFALAFAIAIALLVFPCMVRAGALDRLEDDLQRAFADFPRTAVPSGILLDRVVPIARPQRFDGSEAAPAATPAVLRGS